MRHIVLPGDWAVAQRVSSTAHTVPLHPRTAGVRAADESCNLTLLYFRLALSKGSKSSVLDHAQTLAVVHAGCFCGWQSHACPGGHAPNAFLPYS